LAKKEAAVASRTVSGKIDFVAINEAEKIGG
jgi:hypothetical protein